MSWNTKTYWHFTHKTKILSSEDFILTLSFVQHKQQAQYLVFCALLLHVLFMTYVSKTVSEVLGYYFLFCEECP